jgi:hypothetical protein
MSHIEAAQQAAIQIKAERRHKKEPQAQYATGLGLGSLLPQLRLLSWAALSVGDGAAPARPNVGYLISARGQSNGNASRTGKR